MRLRNKKTGEIAEPFGITCINGRSFIQFDDGKGTFKFEAHSLAELNAEWKDYEEPKISYFINWFGKVSEILGYISDREIEKLKEAGNYFDTREEAEKAVEKLKAWKRLKDKGFRFDGYNSYFEGYWVIYPNDTEGTWCLAEDKADLDLLFGGEE